MTTEIKELEDLILIAPSDLKEEVLSGRKHKPKEALEKWKLKAKTLKNTVVVNDITALKTLGMLFSGQGIPNIILTAGELLVAAQTDIQAGKIPQHFTYADERMNRDSQIRDYKASLKALEACKSFIGTDKDLFSSIPVFKAYTDTNYKKMPLYELEVYRTFETQRLKSDIESILLILKRRKFVLESYKKSSQSILKGDYWHKFTTSSFYYEAFLKFMVGVSAVAKLQWTQAQIISFTATILSLCNKQKGVVGDYIDALKANKKMLKPRFKALNSKKWKP